MAKWLTISSDPSALDLALAAVGAEEQQFNLLSVLASVAFKAANPAPICVVPYAFPEHMSRGAAAVSYSSLHVVSAQSKDRSFGILAVFPSRPDINGRLRARLPSPQGHQSREQAVSKHRCCISILDMFGSLHQSVLSPVFTV